MTTSSPQRATRSDSPDHVAPGAGVWIVHRGGPYAGRVRRLAADRVGDALVYERALAVYLRTDPLVLQPGPHGDAEVWTCTA